MNTTEISRQKLETVESGDLAERGHHGFAVSHQLPNLTVRKRLSNQLVGPQVGTRYARKKMANSTMRYGKEMLSAREQEIIRKQEFEDKVDQFSQFWN